jgi:hypothetical protein
MQIAANSLTRTIKPINGRVKKRSLVIWLPMPLKIFGHKMDTFLCFNYKLVIINFYL